MVLGRHKIWYDELRRDITRDSRPLVRIPCARCSPSKDSGRGSRMTSPFSTSSSTSSSIRLSGGVALSTPSPSAIANGSKVDIEFEKFRRMSEEWKKNRKFDEFDNGHYWTRTSRTPSPSRSIPESKYFKKTASQPSETLWQYTWSSSPKGSPERSLKQSLSFLRSISPGSRKLRSKSPLSFSPVTKTFFRSNSFERDNGYESHHSSRSSSPKSSFKPSSILRKSSKYDENKYHTLPSKSVSTERKPFACIYRRSSSLEKDKNTFEHVRSRSTSPGHLTPASKFYRNRLSPDRSSYQNYLKSRITTGLPDSRGRLIMAAATRRYNEEPSIYRKPLDPLERLESAYNNLRKSPDYSPRKYSDPTVVLTEDTDSFIIGDRIWVGGTKPGSISYIGETQFAPGEWAGVTLDDPVGKNDGTVGGVRYFQCEPKKGVFSRLTRLTRYPMSDLQLEELSSKAAAERKVSGASVGGDSSRKSSLVGESAHKITPTRAPRAWSPSRSKSGSPAPSTLKKNSLPSYSGGAGIPSDLRVGERVIIDSSTGTKYGVLRFLGRTEFANGNWAGVELDDASGKNDGSVAGKRYFVCRTSHGLFAPVTRVRPFGTRSTTSRPPLMTSRRSASPESVAGSSSVSSVRGTRRLCSRSQVPTSGSASKALQRYEYHYEEERFY